VNKDISLHFRFQVIIEILGAINFIHSKGICHNDIAPRNIIISHDPMVRSPWPTRPILIDFGAASFLGRHLPSLSLVLKLIRHFSVFSEQ